jgi:hypothetical protein
VEICICVHARVRVYMRARVVINLEEFRKHNRGRSRYLWVRILYCDDFSVYGDISKAYSIF